MTWKKGERVWAVVLDEEAEADADAKVTDLWTAEPASFDSYDERHPYSVLKMDRDPDAFWTVNHGDVFATRAEAFTEAILRSRRSAVAHDLQAERLRVKGEEGT